MIQWTENKGEMERGVAFLGLEEQGDHMGRNRSTNQEGQAGIKRSLGVMQVPPVTGTRDGTVFRQRWHNNAFV